MFQYHFLSDTCTVLIIKQVVPCQTCEVNCQETVWHEGVEIQLHTFLTLTLDGGEWSSSFLGHLTSRKDWIGDWMDIVASLNADGRESVACAGN
jgi:hypothetical protein